MGEIKLGKYQHYKEMFLGNVELGGQKVPRFKFVEKLRIVR